jgi:nucleoid-associated protein YgaU
VVHVPELASLTQSPILDTTTETFEEAGMPDFSSTLASLPRREVVFDMTDDLEYLVQEGETLSEIATRFDVSTQFLAEYNSLTNADLLKQGQTIIIPSRRNRE